MIRFAKRGRVSRLLVHRLHQTAELANILRSHALIRVMHQTLSIVRRLIAGVSCQKTGEKVPLPH